MISVLRNRKTTLSYQYPIQFWLLFCGLFIARGSLSMIWPFITIFMRQKLDVPLTTVTLLLSIQALASLISTMVVSTLMDRFGRKTAMVVSMFLNAGVLVAMAFSSQLEIWAILIALYGALNPIFGVGVNTMVADLIPAEQRTSAYALTRMISNAGIAIGPILGGLLAQSSFELVYLSTAVVYVIIASLVMAIIHETMPTEKRKREDSPSGYGYILRDGLFMSFFAVYMLVELTNTQVFTLLPVYTVENFGLREYEYSLLFTVNAGMVVLLQYGITQFTRRFRPMLVMGIAALFYTVGAGSIAFGYNLPTFILSMVIVTVGELLIMPTATTLVANIAPMDMRARYMGLYWLAYPLAAGIGPVIGGYVNDYVSPSAIWTSAGAVSLIAALCFFMLARWRLWTAEALAPAVSGGD